MFQVKWCTALILVSFTLHYADEAVTWYGIPENKIVLQHGFSGYVIGSPVINHQYITLYSPFTSPIDTRYLVVPSYHTTGDPLHFIHSWYNIYMVSCQKGPICHAQAWRVGPFWQDTLDLAAPTLAFITHQLPSPDIDYNDTELLVSRHRRSLSILWSIPVIEYLYEIFCAFLIPTISAKHQRFVAMM